MNHCFASSKRNLTGDVLHETIVEINQRRFAGVYEILRNGDNWQVNHALGWNYGFSCWLRTQRKVEFRKEPGDWASWTTAVFQAEIATKFNGKCSDEGIPDIWEPDLEKYPTYKSWWWLINSDSYDAGENRELGQRWTKVLAKLPHELERFV